MPQEHQVKRTTTTRRTRKYYILVERDTHLSAWKIHHGDYKRADVEAERQDRRDHGAKATNLRIIETTDQQEDIDRRLERLNTV